MQIFAQHLMRTLDRFLRRLFLWSWANPRLCWALGLLCVGAAALALPSLRIMVSVDEQFEEDSVARKELVHLREEFAVESTAVLHIWSQDGQPLSQNKLCQIRSLLGDLSLPPVRSIQSLFDLRWPFEQADLGVLNLMKVVDPLCTPNRWQSAAQIAFAPQTTRDLTKPADLLRQQTLLPMYLNSNLSRTLVQLRLHDINDSQQLSQNLKFIEDKVTKKLWGSGLGHTLTGSLVQQNQVRKAIERDQGLNLLAAFLILVLCRVSFRFWRVGGILVTSLVLTTVLTLGTLAWMSEPMDMIANGLFTILAVATVQDFLFLAIALKKRQRGQSKLAFTRILTPCFLTTLTTVVGFGSLALDSPPPLARFGLYASLGVLLEWAVVFLFFPAALRLFPKIWPFSEQDRTKSLNPEKIERIERIEIATRKTDTPFQKGVRSLIRHLRTLRFFWSSWIPKGKALLFLTLLIPLSLLGFGHLKVGDDPLEAFPKSHPQRVSTDELNEKFGYKTEVSLLFRKNFPREKLDELAAWIRQRPEVFRLILPSQILDTASAHLTEDTRGVFLREAEGHPSFKSFFSKEQSRAILLLNSTDTNSVSALDQKVSSLCPNKECQLAGDIYAYAIFADRVTRSLVKSLAVSLALVFALLYLISKALNFRNPWRVLLGCAWGPCLTLGLLPILPIQVNFVTSVFASVVVSLAGDNAIQYWWAGRKRGVAEGLLLRRRGSLLLAQFMIPLSLILCLSAFSPPRTLGWLLSLAFALMIFGDVAYLSGLLKTKRT